MSVMKPSLLFAAVSLIAVAGSAGDFEIPFELDPRRSAILIKASVNNRPALMIVDTGATNTMIHYEVVGLPDYRIREARFSTTGPGLRAEVVWTETRLTIGELSWTRRPIAATRFEEVSRGFGRRIDGIVGQDLLREFRSVQIDFKKNRLVLSR